MALHDAVLTRYQTLPPWLQASVRVAIVLLVGYVLLKLVKGHLNARLKRESLMDMTVRVFLVRVLVGTGWVIIVAAALTAAGVDLTALLGGLAIGGFVIGFALKDTLGNLAAGVMLLVYRPFNIGDTVTIGSHTGSVLELGMALTVIKLFDGKLVTIPNGSVLGGAIVNFSRTGMRRMEVPVGIGYKDDIDAATRAILDMVAQEPRVLSDPAPQVVVTNLGESSVDLEVRAWAKTADFGAINDLRPRIKKAVEGAGCSIPYPQRDLHVYQHEAAGASPPG